MAERTDKHDIPRGRRLRSAALLVLLVSGLGVVAAAVVGLLAVALTSLVDHALG